jgi:hypothetical protein
MPDTQKQTEGNRQTHCRNSQNVLIAKLCNLQGPGVRSR